jgi:stage V sporulation protein G
MDLKTKVVLFESGAQKAFADVTIDGNFVIKGVRIMNGSKGLFLSMPSRKNSDKEKESSGKAYQEIFFPITKSAREELYSAVLDAYDKKCNETASGENKTKSKSEPAQNQQNAENEDIPF